MEDRELFKSFSFHLFSFATKHQTNRSQGAPWHYIGYLYKGSGRLVSAEGTLELQAGDLFYIPKGCRYRSCWYGDEGAQFDSFAFSAIPQEAYTSYRLQKIPVTDEIRALHKDLAKDRRVNARSVGALYRLLWHLFPNMEHSPFAKSDTLAREIANYICEHPEESSPEIARACGVSESTMYHVLKKTLNKTPNQLRREAKCKKAINLLSCTDLSVEEISSRLGFSSSSYMRKLLRATTGKTPLKIRNSDQNM